MREEILKIVYQHFNNSEELSDQDSWLLIQARAALENAYAPYSGFYVGAAVLLANGRIVTGSNQENAAYPMCLCAERVALSAAAADHPGVAPLAIAVTCRNSRKVIDTPASPCGACRQVICEMEYKYQQPIAVILQGETGEVIRFASGAELLPFVFTGDKL